LKALVAMGQFSHAQFDQIGHLNPRIKMSIALNLQKNHAVEINFEKLLYPTGAKDSLKGQRLYSALSRLGKTFVTTNYDEWLDKAIDVPAASIVSVSDPSTTPKSLRTVVYKVDEFSHQEKLLSNLATYYRTFGIQVIPFLRDNKDWEQLIDVLEDFARRAPAGDLMKLQKLADMEDLLNG
jgi:hypothetical protein